MSEGQGRYLPDPRHINGQKDIVSYVAELFGRVKTQEQSLQAGFTSIEGGNFVIRDGDIIVSEDDDTIVLRILHGVEPEIRLFPLGETDTHLLSIFGYDFNNDVDNPDQALQIYVSLNDLSPDGGKLLLTRQFAIFSHQPDGANESFLWLNSQAGFSEEIAVYRGRWSNQQQFDSNMGLYMGAFTATSGVTTWTHTYSTPFSTTTVPVFTVGVNGTTISWGIDNYSTSSFIIRFSTTTGNKFVTFWNFRV